MDAGHLGEQRGEEGLQRLQAPGLAPSGTAGCPSVAPHPQARATPIYAWGCGLKSVGKMEPVMHV